jgi:hypothetical protein
MREYLIDAVIVDPKTGKQGKQYYTKAPGVMEAKDAVCRSADVWRWEAVRMKGANGTWFRLS